MLLLIILLYNSNKCIAVRKVATPLRELTCHMGSHSVTCHPAELTFPPLPQPKLVLDLATSEGCKAELTFYWWGADMVIRLERGADLHMAQLMPLPLTVSLLQ